MEVSVPAGKYVIAVSGGVDSMVLLDSLSALAGVDLVAAHFNHGIRDDAGQDEGLVRDRAHELNLPFEAGYGHLGPKISEEAARNARYGFLKAVAVKSRAAAIITAHHQDDWIETALLNVLRGSGRKGLSAISDNKSIIRPLLKVSKDEIIKYAKDKGLQWREDSSNGNTDYLRNYLRNEVLPRMSAYQKMNFICNLDKVAKINCLIDQEIATLSHNVIKPGRIDRTAYADLPSDITKELLRAWLRQVRIKDFDRGTINRLDLAVKTARPGSYYPVKASGRLKFTADEALLVSD